MRRRSPLEYDVSVTADKLRRMKKRGMSGETAATDKLCEHPGCDDPARYRAPRAPGDENRFRWFCLDHVREYNRGWNFFADWDEGAIDAQMRNDRVWDRPTWGMGAGPRGAQGMHAHSEGRAWERFGFADPMDVLGENATINPREPAGETRRAPMQRRLPPEIRRALDILGAQDGETRAAIRTRYRALVKDLHPDMNGGDRRDEGRLRRVLWAWEQIKRSPAFPK